MADELRPGYELYFAYGSNMLSGRLMERGIETLKLGNATLPAHTLRFHKRSLRDGSGKADAVRTNDPNALIHGVIFKVSKDRLAILDKIEGADPWRERPTLVWHDWAIMLWRALWMRAQ